MRVSGVYFAQDAQSGCREYVKFIATGTGVDPILAIAQEREVIVHQPLQQGSDISSRHRVGRAVLPDCGGIRPEVRADLQCMFAHLRPVLDGGSYVSQYTHDAFSQFDIILRQVVALHFDAHPGFGDGACRALMVNVDVKNFNQPAIGITSHREQWMNDYPHGSTLASELTGHRINQERHVISDDAQDSRTWLIRDAHEGRAYTSLPSDLPHGPDLLNKSSGAGGGEVLSRNVVKEPLGEDAVLRIGEFGYLLAQFLQAQNWHGVTLLQMPRDVVREFIWTADPESVYNVFTRADFQRALAARTGSLHVDVNVSESPQGRVIQTSRTLPAQVPSFARPLVGETVRVDEEQRWQAPLGGSSSADLHITFSGPLVGRGSIDLRPGPAPGTTTGRFALTFKANVPLVGGKVEALIAEQIEQYLQVQAALVAEELDLTQS